jgi:hypothetical protein
LGVFGFLAGQEVKDGGALNAGIRKFRPLHALVILSCRTWHADSRSVTIRIPVDQQAALQWVQAHIDKASSVTIVLHSRIFPLTGEFYSSVATQKTSRSMENLPVQVAFSSM